MSGPAGVADAVRSVDGVFAEDGVEVAEFAGGAAELEAVGVTVGGNAAGDGDACGIVAAVFQAGEAFHDDRDTGLRTDVTDDSAHISKV